MFFHLLMKRSYLLKMMAKLFIFIEMHWLLWRSSNPKRKLRRRNKRRRKQRLESLLKLQQRRHLKRLNRFKRN